MHSQADAKTRQEEALAGETEAHERELYFSWAIREAIEQEMERDPTVILIGEDIAVYGGAFRVTKGLLEKFGPHRVIDTPISENSFVGIAVGAALAGLRPIVEIMFMDFITLAMDAIVNHAANFRYVYGEQAKVPMVIRCPAGGGRAYGATHSKTLEAWFMHTPGVKVVVPATPYDAKGLLISSIRDDNPVIFIECKLLYSLRGNVPAEPYTVELGKARVAREGDDITLISYGRMVHECEKAAEMLLEEGISAEVVDLRSLSPMDTETIAKSVTKTGRAVVVAEDNKFAGASAEIMCQVVENCFEYLDAPVLRVAAEDVPIPCAPNLERAILPNAFKIYNAAKALLNWGRK
jgi:pyruvate dehydrogenase E1 component beta subunit